jgi:hypothetical protein
MPGIFESLEKMVIADQKKHQQVIDTLRTDPKRFVLNRSSLQGKAVLFTNNSLTHLIFNSNIKNTFVLSKNHCSFIDYLRLHYPEKNPQAKNYKLTIADVQQVNNFNKNIIGVNEITNYFLASKCQSHLALADQFQDNKLKQTLNDLDFQVPNSKKQCLEVFNQLREDQASTYLCYFDNKMKQARKLLTKKKLSSQDKDKLTQYQVVKNFLGSLKENYLSNFCKHLYSPDQFCQYFFKKSFFNHFVNQPEKYYLFQNQCAEALALKDKKNLSFQDIESCSSKFREDPKVCMSLNKEFQALFPKQSCQDLRLAFSLSDHRFTFKDCPGKIMNEGLTNISRILSFFNPIKNEKTNTSIDNCEAAIVFPFARTVLEQERTNAWGSSLCYSDRLNAKEICSPVVFTKNPGSTLSVSNVVKGILVKKRGMDPAQKCRFIDEKEYNPLFLRYKTGCYLLYDPKNCNAGNCDFKTILNERTINNLITSKSSIDFQYFHVLRRYEHLSLLSLISRLNQLKNKSVENLSDLKLQLRKKEHLLHGIGCKEDLLPTHFKRYFFQQCTPLPFIVDSFVELEDQINTLVSIRTAIDEIQFPRVIQWNRLYYAVKNFQLLHPSKRWSLHVLHR